MSVFVDTNILLRSVQPSDPQHRAAVRAISSLLEAKETLVVTPQVLAEFWYAATRPPEKNGLGLSLEQARQELDALEDFFVVLPESGEVYDKWKELLIAYAIRGVHAHDARLAAAMVVHNIDRILTFDTDDFARYKEITAVHPDSLDRGVSTSQA